MVRQDGLLAAATRQRPTWPKPAKLSNRLFVCRRFELPPIGKSYRFAVQKFLWNLVRPDGFEPPTTAFEAQCSIQLSYGRPRAV
jgi:hypothetical protein